MLTFLSAVMAAAQAGLVKLPTLVDLTERVPSAAQFENVAHPAAAQSSGASAAAVKAPAGPSSSSHGASPAGALTKGSQ